MTTTSSEQGGMTTFRLTSITFDTAEHVATASAIASGECLDLVRALLPAVRPAGGFPAVVTLARTDIVRLHTVAGRILVTDPRSTAAAPITTSLRGVVRGLIDTREDRG